MKMSKEDEAKLDAFIGQSLDYIKAQDKPHHYKPNTKHKPGDGVIELISGILVPESTESVLVLDKEYVSYLIGHVYKFLKLMQENIDNPLFGFAERPLYELITLWLFIELHNVVPKAHKERVKVLLFTGHFKFVTKDKKDLAAYLKQRGSSLTANDNSYLADDTKTGKEYFTRVWNVAGTIKSTAGATYYESVLAKYGNYAAISGHQSMRVHANPLSINETLDNSRAKLRRKILLALYTAQVCDYMASNKDAEASKIVKAHEDLRNQITVEVEGD